MRVSQFSRRTVIAAAVAAPGVALLGHQEVGAAQATPDASSTPAAPVGQASAPNWTFTVTQVANPYKGQLTRPKELDPGTMAIGAEIIITNGSDQPLNFSTADIVLKDEAGVSYPSGSTLGSEPRIVSQDLPDGERTRGWVWFAVPDGTVATQLIFTGPSPQFRVALPRR
ncbi:MAG TPA: DUF4352 domain-containing protein [Thermomicrobiales bacterium]|jgi:hypothetical protein|nr:DUF4352 domain-containing protein [Thermomicrobiales bacterium]